MCSKHFEQEDFLIQSIDKNSSCHGARTSKELHRLHLKADAVPHIFPNTPAYLSKPCTSHPSANVTTAAARLEKENKFFLKQNDMVLLKETFNDFGEFREKIQQEILPKGYITVIEDNFA